MPSLVQRVNHLSDVSFSKSRRRTNLADDGLEASGTLGREDIDKVGGTVGVAVLALLDLAAVGEVFTADLAGKVVRVPLHAERLQRGIDDLLAATGAGW